MSVVRTAGRAAALAPALFVLLLALPRDGLAHGALRRAQPGSGDHLSAAPSELRLTFTEPVELALARLALTGPAGPVALGPPALDPDSATVLVSEIQGPLVAGTYTVTWQVTGADGHPVRGNYSFVIAPGATGLHEPAADTALPTPLPPEHHPATTFPTGSGFDAESPLYAAVRWLNFVGLLGLIGAAAFRLLVLPLTRRRSPALEHVFVQPASDRTAALGLAMAGLVLAAALLRLLAQSYALHGGEGALDPALVATMLVRTMWGWGWILQALGALLALLGFALARRSASAGWALAALATVALAFAPGLSGHAAATPGIPALAVTADALHVLGAGGWLGSLLLVVVVGIPVALRRTDGHRESALAAVVNAFSPTALGFAGVVVATGILAAWLRLGSVPALWESAYGRTLLLKLAVLLVVFGTGAYNWLRVRPALGEEKAARRLRRSAAVELAMAVVVLAVTAALVATPPPEGDTAAAALVAGSD